MWNNNGMDWGSMGGGGWVVMTLVMLAFWALVVGGLVALFRSRPAVSKGVSDSGPTPGPRAESVLDERFARGEIDEQEYQARRAVLSSAQRR